MRSVITTPTPAGAQAVFKFLDAQSKSISTYDTNPLWQVVSGPWKLKSMDTAGNVSMVPNTAYGGPVKPTLTQFNEVPYTQGHRRVRRAQGGDVADQRDRRLRLPSVERRAGEVDARQRLQLRTVDGLADHVLPGELHQPDQRADLQPAVLPAGDAGPGRPEHLHQQGVLRIRVSDLRPGADQADLELRRLVREVEPVSVQPDARRSRCCKANGWTVNPGGTSTCTSPGTGTGQCGAGRPAGREGVLQASST